MSRNARRFSSKYHHVGNQHLTRRKRLRQCNKFLISELRSSLLGLCLVQRAKGSTNVGLALNLNVVAVCVVFMFVGAILFGAF
jgi:hypothetical protein